jgi:hypothetical protein
MKNQERQDIALPSSRPWIYFGDGTMAQIMDMSYSKDAKGIDIWKMRIAPAQHLLKIQRIGLEYTDEEGFMQVEYPVQMIEQLSMNPIWPVYFTYLDVWGNATPTSRIFKGHQDATKVLQLMEQINLKEAENAYLREKYEEVVTNPTEYISKHVMPLIESLRLKLPSMENQPQIVSPARND